MRMSPTRRSRLALTGLTLVGVAMGAVSPRELRASDAPLIRSTKPKVYFASERDPTHAVGTTLLTLNGAGLWRDGAASRAFVRGTRGAGCFEEIAVTRNAMGFAWIELPVKLLLAPDRLDVKMVVGGVESNAHELLVLPRPKSIEWLRAPSSVPARTPAQGWAPESYDDIRVEARGMTDETRLLVLEDDRPGRGGEQVFPEGRPRGNALKAASEPSPSDNLMYYYPATAEGDLAPGEYDVVLADRDIRSAVVRLHVYGLPAIRSISPNPVYVLPKGRERGTSVTVDLSAIGDAPDVVYRFFLRGASQPPGTGVPLAATRRSDGRSEVVLPPSQLMNDGTSVLVVRNGHGVTTANLEIRHAELIAPGPGRIPGLMNPNSPLGPAGIGPAPR